MADLSDTNNSGIEEMGLLPRSGIHEAGTRRAAITWSAVFAGLFGMVYFVAGATFLAGRSQETAATHEPQPLTVRSLLESDKLTNLATDNLLLTRSVQGERPAVKALVHEGFMNISKSIASLYPNAHRKMDQLVLNKQQEEAALAKVRKFGDWRAIKLTKTISDAVGESKRAGEDPEAMKKRLMAALAPSFEHLKQIHNELQLVQDSSTKRDLHTAPSQGVEEKSSAASVSMSSRRRLEETHALLPSSISNGVRVHARQVFHSLESTLGDDMPTAPSRMLSIFDNDSNGYNRRPSSSSQGSTMGCIQEAAPNPMEMCECLVRHVPNLMEMLQGFMQKMGMA